MNQGQNLIIRGRGAGQGKESDHQMQKTAKDLRHAAEGRELTMGMTQPI
jgi:hypothetical protein